MHTFDYDDPEKGEIFVHHNGDFSGDVIINIDSKAVNKYELESNRVEVHLPFELLQDLVMSKIRSDMIQNLEQMSSNELLEALSSL